MSQNSFYNILSRSLRGNLLQVNSVEEAEEKVPSHQELGQLFKKQEKKVDKILIILVAIISFLLIFICFLVYLEPQNQTHFFNQSEQDQQKILSKEGNVQDLNYIRIEYDQPITEIESYLQTQVQNILNTYKDHNLNFAKDLISDFQSNFSKFLDVEEVKESQIALESYSKKKKQLKRNFANIQDSLQIMQEKQKNFDFCKNKLGILQEVILNKSYILQNKKSEILRFNGELQEIGNQMSKQKGDNQKQMDILIRQQNEFQKKLKELTDYQTFNYDIQKQIKSKQEQNIELERELNQLYDQKPQVLYNIQETNSKIIDIEAILRLKIEQRNQNQTHLTFLELEIAEKNLDMTISDILKEIGLHNTVKTQQIYADKIKKRLGFLKRLQLQKESQFNSSEIKEQQNRYKEIIKTIIKIKRQAFIQKKFNIEPVLNEYLRQKYQKESNIQRLNEEINRLENMKIEQKSMTNDLQERLHDLDGQITYIEKLKKQNQDFIDLNEQAPDRQDLTQEQIEDQINELLQKSEKINNQISNRETTFKDEKYIIENKKTQLIQEYRDIEYELNKHIDTLNYRINQCKDQEQEVLSIFQNSQDQLEDINSLFDEIQQLKEKIKDQSNKLQFS